MGNVQRVKSNNCADKGNGNKQGLCAESERRNGEDMEKIRIITDSASDITGEVMLAKGIRAGEEKRLTVLPMRINFGAEEYLDGVTISHHQFYEKLVECDELPVTSLVSPATYEAEYEKAVGRGEKVVVITISGKLSGTYQSAVLAAEEYKGQVYVVDSRNATLGEQLLVRYALKLAEKGLSAKEIAEYLEKVREQIHIVGLLDTLEYLKKGGRISKTVAFMGGVLSVKPVLTVQDGEIVMLGKARGSKNGNNFLIAEIEKAQGIDFAQPFCLGYTGLDDSLLQKYIADSEHLWRNYTEELPVCTVGAAIGTHVGPNAIVVAFFAAGKGRETE